MVIDAASRPLTPEIILNDDHNDDHQQASLPKIIDNSSSSSSLIGPFKNELELCLFLVQRPDIINLALNMARASGQESTSIIQGKPDKFHAFPEKVI